MERFKREHFQTYPRRFKMAQDAAKTAQGGPRCFQDAPKSVPHSPQAVSEKGTGHFQDGFRAGPGGFSEALGTRLGVRDIQEPLQASILVPLGLEFGNCWFMFDQFLDDFLNKFGMTYPQNIRCLL